nr:MAG TPA: hypothetical protein [Caudoviricetes sp.]
MHSFFNILASYCPTILQVIFVFYKVTNNQLITQIISNIY